MYNYFLLQGRRAILREVIAAWFAVSAAAVLFGILFAKYHPAGEGVALVVASVVSIPVAVFLLQAVRLGRLKLPDVAIPKGDTLSESERKTLESLTNFWKSLDPEERKGLQWLTSALAASALTEIQTTENQTEQELGSPSPFPFPFHPEDMANAKQRILENGKREITFPMRGKEDHLVTLMVDDRTREITCTVRRTAMTS